MDIGPRSMAAVWMVGLEDQPARSAEICSVKVFGAGLIGAPQLPIDVSDAHTYAADWQPGRAGCSTSRPRGRPPILAEATPPEETRCERRSCPAIR